MDSKIPITIDSKTGLPDPYSSSERIKLSTIRDVRLEMSSLYRMTKKGQMDTTTAGRLAYILTQVGKLLEMEKIEPRIRELEERLK